MDLEQQFAQDRAEARSVAFTDVDISNDGWSFEGLAGVYGDEADIGEFTESVMRGAYRKAVPASGNIPMLYHHNDQLPVLATTAAGTLTLTDDARGLRVKADIAKHYVGEAVRELVNRGDIKGMSAGFIVGRGNSRVEQRQGGKPHRTIMDFKKILDVSPTWDPAYSGTSAELRSLRALQIAESLEDAQHVLSGTYQQLENRAHSQIADTGDDEEQEATEEVVDEPAGVSANDVEVRAAARRRRLQMMGLTLLR